MVNKIKGLLSRLYVAFILVFLYLPIAVLVVLSFNNSKSRVTWGGLTLKWYTSLLSNHQIMDALTTTLLIAFASALISTIIGTVGALGICSLGKKSYRTIMVFTNIPMVNADIVTGIALMLFFVRFFPLGKISVLLAHITFNIPYVILSVMPKIRQMNHSIYEASRDLGAGPVYAFFKVTLPQLSSGIISGFFMAFTMSMDDFVITYFTKGAGVNTLSTMLYGEMKKGIKPEMYALSTIMFTVVFIVLMAVNLLSADKEKKGRKIEA